jgi:hypothetical protein
MGHGLVFPGDGYAVLWATSLDGVGAPEMPWLGWLKRIG